MKYTTNIYSAHRSKSATVTKSRSQHSCITSPALPFDFNPETAISSDEESVCSDNSQLQTRDFIKKQLMARWRYPTLTVHKIDVSMDNPTIISHCATATVSMRTVPNQDISDICAQFKYYMRETFDQLKSGNQIKVISHCCGFMI